MKSALVLAALWVSAAPPAGAAGMNPIARIARAFNDDLVAIESRISWIRNRQASLAKVRACPLDTGLGFLGGRPDANSPAPWVTVDLGSEFPIESIFLVPSQHLPGSAPCLFPLRFRIEAAEKEDFSDAVTVLDQSKKTTRTPSASRCPSSQRTSPPVLSGSPCWKGTATA